MYTRVSRSHANEFTVSYMTVLVCFCNEQPDDGLMTKILHRSYNICVFPKDVT
jgi:hypothetical protein